MLNLARQPFVNDRPLRRLSVVLWVLGAALLVVNAALYWRHFSGAEERNQRLEQYEAELAAEREMLKEHEAALADVDLEWQNRQVRFLNLRIGERTFPWSRLFDQLGAVLPRDVRVTLLRPTVGERERRDRRERRAGEAPGAETVLLELRGEARSGEALLELLEALFEHPRFIDPNLASEARDERAETIGFILTVLYLPERGATDAVEAAAEPEAEVEEVAAEGRSAQPAADESEREEAE